MKLEDILFQGKFDPDGKHGKDIFAEMGKKANKKSKKRHDDFMNKKDMMFDNKVEEANEESTEATDTEAKPKEDGKENPAAETKDPADNQI